jgi:hypothetical protein
VGAAAGGVGDGDARRRHGGGGGVGGRVGVDGWVGVEGWVGVDGRAEQERGGVDAPARGVGPGAGDELGDAVAVEVASGERGAGELAGADPVAVGVDEVGPGLQRAGDVQELIVKPARP